MTFRLVYGALRITQSLDFTTLEAAMSAAVSIEAKCAAIPLSIQCGAELIWLRDPCYLENDLKAAKARYEARQQVEVLPFSEEDC